VTVECAGELPEVEADPIRLEQVLGNLLGNAAKYGAADTPIRVVAERCDGEVRMSVENRGPGIPPDELGRLFRRFHRARRAAGGVSGIGLGLYIAKGIVEAHGGRIWA
jgi:signal transduction histidine kinase